MERPHPEYYSSSQRTRECGKVHTGKSSSLFLGKIKSYGQSGSNVVREGRVSSDREEEAGTFADSLHDDHNVVLF